LGYLLLAINEPAPGPGNELLKKKSKKKKTKEYAKPPGPTN